MRSMTAATVALMMVLSACVDLGTTGPTTTPPTGATTTSITLPSTTTTAPPATGCSAGAGGFVERGPVTIIGSPSSDATQISSITVAPSGVCERLEVGLVTSGSAPATAAPETSVEILPDAGIVRLELSAVIASSAITDSLIESSLVDRAFVVRGLNGRLFIDLLLRAPAAARATELRNPARIAIELRPDGLEPGQVASVGDAVVVTAPDSRVVEYPYVVTGYARTFEANVVARLSSEGSVIAEYVTQAADWLETWGEFRIEIPEGPGGDTELFVGEDSARDGTPVGVTLQLNAG